ncbi:MAG: hypothetical protein SF029_18910 [bacterium]|nr:hypothetical protein [bacterium]
MTPSAPPIENSPALHLRRRTFTLIVILFFGMSSFYLLFFTADIFEFGDPPYLFNMTASLVRYQDMMFDLMAFNHPDRPDNVWYRDRLYPLYSYREDPLSVVLATPLYWLAYHLPGIGLVHATWLLNIFVCAGAVCALFQFARLIGYDERTSLLAAVTFGAATLVLPYSRSFMQEPTAMLTTLLLAYAIVWWRQKQYQPRGFLLVIVLLEVLMLTAKRTSVAGMLGLLPLALIAPPAFFTRRRQKIALASLAGLLILLAWVNVRGLVSPSVENASQTMIALRAYLFSPTASLWATSPVLLLAIPAVALAWRSGRLRYVGAAVLMTVGYMLGYAFFHSDHWYGSVTWPVRYFLPVIPFWIIAALPVFQRIVHTPRSRLLTGTFVVLLVYGLWINFNAVTYRWDTYDKLLPPGTIMTRGEAAFHPAWMPWVLLPRLWQERPFEFVWNRTDQPVFPLMFITLVLLCGCLLWFLRRHRNVSAFVMMLPVWFVICLYVGLRLIYIDPLYFGQSADLHQSLEVIESRTEPPDLVFVTSADHIRFFFNYAKLRHARLTGLSFQPGERYSPDQPPLVADSFDYNQLLSPTTIPLLRASAAQRERFFLLADLGPFHPWAVRPVEAYLASEFYPVDVTEINPGIRLIEYDTGRLDDGAGEALSVPLDFEWEDGLRATRFVLPEGALLRPGTVLAASIAWEITQQPSRDYTVALFLVDESQRVVAQAADSYPAGGFGTTRLMPAGFAFNDNRGMRLPSDLPPGNYHFWIQLYARREDGSLDLLSVSAGEVLDETLAVVPLTISAVAER